MKHFIYALALSFAVFGSAQASIDTFEFSNQAERERYRTLVEELRVRNCQNQEIADSDAPIAMDMRVEIFNKLERGESNEEIVDYLVGRSGDFVRYKPPVNKSTLVLWYAPAGFLLFGFAMVAIIVMRRRRAVTAQDTEQSLSGEEKDRLADILKQYK